MPRKKKASKSATQTAASDAPTTASAPTPRQRKKSAPSKARVAANRAAFRAHIHRLLPVYGGNREEALIAAVADFTDADIRDMAASEWMEVEVEVEEEAEVDEGEAEAGEEEEQEEGEGEEEGAPS